MKLGGHRGMGCTDHDFFQGIRDIAHLPVENTLESFAAAYKAGADYFETDAVMSADGVVFTIHNVLPNDHFFGDRIPPKLLNKMNFADIRQYKSGRYQKGEIPRLEDVLAFAAEADPRTLPFAMNLEIKGVILSNQPYETNDFLERVMAVAKKSPLPLERILWSSYTLKSLLAVSHVFPQSKFGMLMDIQEEGLLEQYTDHTKDPLYQSMPFDMWHIEYVRDMWRKHANPAAVLGYIHPDTATITREKIDVMKKYGWGINCNGYREVFTPERAAMYQSIIDYTSEKGVFFSATTDYISEIQKLKF